MRRVAQRQSSELQKDQSTRSRQRGCEGRSSMFAMVDLASVPCTSRLSTGRRRSRIFEAKYRVPEKMAFQRMDLVASCVQKCRVRLQDAANSSCFLAAKSRQRAVRDEMVAADAVTVEPVSTPQFPAN